MGCDAFFIFFFFFGPASGLEMVSLKASLCTWKGSWYQREVVWLVIGRSTSHFQPSFSPSVLAGLCVCGEEARGGGIGVGMKVGHSRFCLVARQNSRLTLTPLNGGRVLRLTDAVEPLFSVGVLQICMCYLCHVGYVTWSFGLWSVCQLPSV